MVKRFFQMEEWITGSKLLDVAIFMQLLLNIALTIVIINIL